MFRNNRLLRVIIQFFAVTVPLVLSALSVFNAGGAVNYAYYVVVFLGALWFAADTLGKKDYAPAFEFERDKGMNIISYALSFGFFAEFLNCCMSAYDLFNGRSYIALIYVFIQFYTLFTALLSAIYFIIVGMSYGGRYDFRYLKIMHLLPLFWASGKMFELLLEAGVTSVDDVNSVTGFFVLTFALCFFYSFAREVENSGGTKRSTVLLSSLLAYLSLLYVFNLIAESIYAKGEGILSRLLTGVTFVTLLIFCFMFTRNVSVTVNNTEN